MSTDEDPAHGLPEFIDQSLQRYAIDPVYRRALISEKPGLRWAPSGICAPWHTHGKNMTCYSNHG